MNERKDVECNTCLHEEEESEGDLHPHEELNVEEVGFIIPIVRHEEERRRECDVHWDGCEVEREIGTCGPIPLTKVHRHGVHSPSGVLRLCADGMAENGHQSELVRCPVNSDAPAGDEQQLLCGLQCEDGHLLTVTQVPESPSTRILLRLHVDEVS